MHLFSFCASLKVTYQDQSAVIFMLDEMNVILY